MDHRQLCGMVKGSEPGSGPSVRISRAAPFLLRFVVSLMSHPELSPSPPLPRRPSVTWVLPVVRLGLGGLGFAVLSRPPARPTAPAGKPLPVRTQVTPLKSQDHAVTVRSQGVVRARHEVVLSAQVQAKVQKVAATFEPGAFFRAGTVLVELESDDYQTAVASAEAGLKSTTAAHRLAELNHRRNQTLQRNSPLPEAQAETSAAALAQAEAEREAASARVERARRDLERTRIRAPFDGCVRRRAVAPGQLVGPGTPLGEVFSVDTLELRLPIAGRDLRFLDLPEQVRHHEIASDPGYWSAGLRVDWLEEPSPEVALSDSLDPATGPRWTGHILRAESALDENTLDVLLLVHVHDPFGLESGSSPLRLGQPVIAAIRGRTLTNVMVLPRSAVRELDRIHLVDPNTLTLSSRRIVPLWANEEQVVMRDPSIAEGTLLATTHLVYAPEGSTVEILPDAAAGSDPAKSALSMKGAAP